MKFLNKLLPFLERVFLIILVIYPVSKLLGTSNIAFLIIGLLGFAMVNFLFAYVPIETEESEQGGFAKLLCIDILPKVLGISTSVATIGILFHILNMEGAPLMLTVGSITILTSLLIFTTLKLSRVKGVNQVIPRLFRSVPALLYAAYILQEIA